MAFYDYTKIYYSNDGAFSPEHKMVTNYAIHITIIMQVESAIKFVLECNSCDMDIYVFKYFSLSTTSEILSWSRKTSTAEKDFLVDNLFFYNPRQKWDDI